MNTVFKYLYRIYQLFVAVPLSLVATIITALTVAAGCSVGNGHFWGYYPGRWWSWLVVRLFLIPVTVEGRENMEPGQSYVFVSNHQGAFDIFLIYGFLGRNFKWMMKRGIMKIPFVGFACKAAHHIFVDKRSPARIKETYEEARHTLQSGMSVVVFPGVALFHRPHGHFQERGVYFGRRVAAARGAAHHQRVVRHHAPHT